MILIQVSSSQLHAHAPHALTSPRPSHPHVARPLLLAQAWTVYTDAWTRSQLADTVTQVFNAASTSSSLTAEAAVSMWEAIGTRVLAALHGGIEVENQAAAMSAWDSFSVCVSSFFRGDAGRAIVHSIAASRGPGSPFSVLRAIIAVWPAIPSAGAQAQIITTAHRIARILKKTDPAVTSEISSITTVRGQRGGGRTRRG
jgi:hypothetical protein